MADAVTTQILMQTEKKVVYKFTNTSDGTGESDVKKVDLSQLTWAHHTLTLSGAASPNFKIGEVLTTGSAETFIVTGFTAGASTVEVVGWDNSNKKAAAIDTGMSNGDAVSGGVSGNNTRTVANSGNFTENDYNVVVSKLQWICNGMNVKIEWDGSTAEKEIATLTGSGSWNCGSHNWPGVPINATGDTAGVLGDIQFSTVGHTAADSYCIWMEVIKTGGYDLPPYEQNSQLGYQVDYLLGNFT